MCIRSSRDSNRALLDTINTGSTRGELRTGAKSAIYNFLVNSATGQVQQDDDDDDDADD